MFTKCLLLLHRKRKHFFSNSDRLRNYLLCSPWNKRVKYNLQVKLYAIVNSGISSYKLFVDDVEVTKFRNSRAFNYSSYEHGNLYQDFEWIFDCDAADDAATGTFAGWNGPKTIRMEMNEYSSTYQIAFHQSGWHGTSGATGDDVLAEPILTITAYTPNLLRLYAGSSRSFKHDVLEYLADAS